MGALLQNAAVRDDGDGVGVLDRGKTMGHDQRRAAFAQFVKCLLDHDFRRVVQGRRGFVQNQHGGVLQEDAGDAEALLLAAAEPYAAFADDRVVAFVQRHDVVVDVGAFRGFDDLLLRRVQPSIEDVVANGRVEEIDVLLHDADVPPQRFHRDVADVHAVQQDAAFLDLIEMRDQMADGRLAAAGRADQSEGLAGLDLHVDVLQDVMLAVVGERHVVEFDFALQPRHVLRAVAIHFRLHIKHFHKPFEACHAALILLHEADQRVHGTEKQVDGDDERRIVRERDLSVVQEETARDQNDDVENVRDERRARMELAHGLVGVTACLLEQRVAVFELLRLLLGVREGLRHADARYGSLQRGVDDGRRLAAPRERAAHPRPHVIRDYNQKRHHHEHDDRQHDVDMQEIRERHDDRYRRDDQIFRTMMRKLRDVKQIRRHSGHDLARFMLVEERKWQLLQMREQIAAHGRLHLRAHHVAFILDEEIQPHPHEIDDQQCQTVDDDHAILAVGDQVVQHRARHDGIDDAGERHQKRRPHVQRKQ